MPNWCTNNLTVEGLTARTFYEENKDDPTDLTFAKSVPNGDWGTKWDIYCDCDCDFDGEETEGGCVTYSFETAWGPPLRWLEQVALANIDLRFEIAYEEAGCDFRGRMVYENGTLVSETDSNFYREPTKEEALDAISKLQIPASFTTKDVETILNDDDVDATIDDIASDSESEDVPTNSELIREAISKVLIQRAKDSALERLSSLFHAVVVLRRFTLVIIKHLNSPDGACYHLAKKRFRNMAVQQEEEKSIPRAVKKLRKQ